MIESGGQWIVPKESYREKGVGVPFLDLRRVRPSWVASLVASTKTPEAELLQVQGHTTQMHKCYDIM